MAGNDAGHAYNDFPLMNGQWVPDEYFSLPGWRNVFESTAAVQLHHRVLALTTLLSVGAVWWSHWGPNARHLPRGPRMLLNGLLSVTCLQVRAKRLVHCIGVALHGSARVDECCCTGA